MGYAWTDRFCTRRPLLSTCIGFESVGLASEEVRVGSLTSVDSFGGAASFLGLRPGFGLAGMTHSFDAAGAWVKREGR